MNILLIQPPIEDFFTTPIRHYPLNLLYVARVLKTYGHQVEIFDFLTPLRKKQMSVPALFRYMQPFIQKHPLLFQHYYRFGRPFEELERAISRFSPQMIGIASQFTAYFSTVARLAGEIKKMTPVPVFIGGHHATVFKDRILSGYPQIDDVFAGPADICLKEFPDSNGRIPADVPMPDWREAVTPHAMLKADYKIGKKKYISLTAGRGCPFRCRFCAVHTMYGHSTTVRPVESVVEEIRSNYRRNVRIFNFEDDNLSFRTRWFSSLLTAIIDDRELDVELTAMNGMCYWTLTEELVDQMAAAGFRSLNLSYITHSPVLRERLQRPRDPFILEKIVKAAQKRGLFMTVYYILGLPGQKYNEIRQTIDYLFSLGILVTPSVFYLPAGSPMYDRLKCKKIKDNWDMFRSSIFAVETENLTREQLVGLFVYTREKNLQRLS